MENIKNYFDLTLDTLVNNSMDFCIYWLQKTPLKYFHIAYTKLFAAAIAFLFFFVLVLFIGISIMLLSSSIFCKGDTFSKKLKNAYKKWQKEMAARAKEYPNSFMYRYLNQLSFMYMSVVVFGVFALKDLNVLWIGFPTLIFSILHDHRIKKKFNYEFNARIDSLLLAIALFISVLICIHFFIIHKMI